MTGSVTGGNILAPVTPSSSPSTSNSSTGSIDTVGILMIPTQDIDDYLAQITGAGITVDNTYDFKDLRRTRRNRRHTDINCMDHWWQGFKPNTFILKRAFGRFAI